ncbi:uncharacterized protein [Palaemon carinicauda]|uniref:uncharacterized protein n=1 Tax=Palaemon carinicauda TaxID=392227 RepID=UPI0035B5F303
MNFTCIEGQADPTRQEDDIADDALCQTLLSTICKRVWAYYNKGDAEAVISLVGRSADSANGSSSDTCGENSKDPWDPLLLWVRPGHCCLRFLANQVSEAELSSVASVGCGTGLLEWLIQATTGLSVMGYEINGDWWSSKYAPPTFIPLTYVDPEDDPPSVPHCHALMCCYFNNARVFKKYVNAYEGPLLIIIGSTSTAKCTEPGPHDYKDVHPWTLKATHNITDTDIIACYVRDPWKVDVANRLRIFTKRQKKLFA